MASGSWGRSLADSGSVCGPVVVVADALVYHPCVRRLAKP